MRDLTTYVLSLLDIHLWVRELCDREELYSDRVDAILDDVLKNREVSLMELEQVLYGHGVGMNPLRLHRLVGELVGEGCVELGKREQVINGVPCTWDVVRARE